MLPEVSATRDYSKLFIGGEWIEPHSADRIESIDPSDETVWATVPAADALDVDRAVSAAHSALHGDWRRTDGSARGRLLSRLASLIRENAKELAYLETRDNGKPIRDTASEVQRAADWIDYFAGAADKIQGETIPYRAETLAYTVREPVGVVAAITPWNSPLTMYAWKLGPALAAGNTVVLKPSRLTPVTALELASLVSRAGFPAGVVNVLTGTGGVVGDKLVTHPLVSKVAFTGDHQTAASIVAASAPSMKRLSLECGGKSPQIVFEDADLERASVVATHAAFRSTGQSCTAGSRLLVQRSIYDAFVREVVSRTERIRIGMPLDTATDIGPQTSAEQRAKTETYIQIGKDEGAHLALGGLRPRSLARGYFIEPTIFTAVDNKSRLAQEEIFGPVLSVIPFDGEEDAVEMANDVKYGLVGGIWTRDVGRAHRVASALEIGFIGINTYRPTHFTLPYGGYKLSGVGRENGLEVLREYTELKTVVVDFSTAHAADPFAAGVRPPASSTSPGSTAGEAP